MEFYLKNLKTNFENRSDGEEVIVVLGNEACDLDSAVSAVVYAHALSVANPDALVTPVLNVDTDDYALKTEVRFLFRKYLPEARLVFRDDVDLARLAEEKCLKIVLVDHNVPTGDHSDLGGCVVEVVDHHQRECNDSVPTVTVAPVGSCCTLVAEKVFGMTSRPEDVACRLLHATILLDTVNLSPDAKRATERDVRIVEKIESVLKFDGRREEVFDEVAAAKRDVSELSAFDLLRKDMKFATNHDKRISIIISSVPLLAKHFIALPDSSTAASKLLEKFSANGLLVMGIQIKEALVERDLALFRGSKLLEELQKFLINSSEPNFQFSLCPKDFNNWNLLYQGNATASRKQVLPVVKLFLN